jgi:hypothetical protein
MQRASKKPSEREGSVASACLRSGRHFKFDRRQHRYVAGLAQLRKLSETAYCIFPLRVLRTRQLPVEAYARYLQAVIRW